MISMTPQQIEKALSTIQILINAWALSDQYKIKRIKEILGTEKVKVVIINKEGITTGE